MMPSAVNLQADEKADKKNPFQPNAQKQAPPQNALNPLKKIIQGWFGGPKAGPQAKAPVIKRTPGYFRFPQDLEQERRFKSVQKLIDDEQWDAARDKLQLMLENSLNLPVHVSGERSLITDRELIYQLLELLPSEQREKFNRQYEALAEKLLNDAQQNHSPPESYAEIASRFSGTQSGMQSMNFLISYHMERGEFGLAEQYLQRLLKSQSPITESLHWKTKAAFIFKQTGKESLIAELFNSARDTSLEEKPIKIGGAVEMPQSWLSKQQDLNLAENLLLDEWPMLFGSPSHSARAKHADPLLIPRWSFPLTSNHSIQSQLNLIQEDLTSAGRATIPALPPLTTQGKIIFRTLKGIQVLDALTGAPLWELALKNSPEESFIAAQLKRLNTPQARGLFDPEARSFSVYNGTNPDSHPLTNLIYRNANWGSQSTDGRQLYVLESMQLNLGDSNLSNNLNRFRRNIRRGEDKADAWSSNQIVAYNLQTGQQKWKIGGTRYDESFDLPLAGTFFMGAPTPSDNELYVIGEREREIRLYALNPQTGEELWSQQIGNPDQDIALDMVRRWWIAPVAVDQGVIVCPTTIGLLTAIDRLNHAVLWSTQYAVNDSDAPQRFNRSQQTSFAPLNQRWCPSAPVISGNKVIYTPPDSETLVCLDLITGSYCWTKRAKETSLYLAGVVENQILLVGTNGARAISLKTGKTDWSTRFEKSAGQPSGLAVIADQRLHIPLQSGQVWTLDVKSGKIINKLFNENHASPLGNLIIQNGQFLSLSATGLVSYEQKQTFEAQIAKTKQQNAQNPLALLKESRMLMMSHAFPDALLRLRQIDQKQLPAQEQNQLQTLILNCLSSQIRSDFQKHDDLVEQLKQQVRSDSERIEFQRLLVERHVARKQFSDAIALLLELAQAPEETFFQTAATETQIDSWIAGRASDLSKQVTSAEREQFSLQIAQRAQQVLGLEQQQQERFLQQFGFDDATIPVLQQVIATSMNSGNFYETELWLTRLVKHKQPQLAAQGLSLMVDLCLKFHLNPDAEYYLARLRDYDPNLQVSDNQTLQQFLEQKQQIPLTDVEQHKRKPWRPQKLKLIVGNPVRYYSAPEITLNTSASSLPFFQTRTLAVEPKQNRLTIFAPDGKRLIWSTPLRSSDLNRSPGFNESEVVGHNLILQHRDMLHFFDLIGQKLIWSQKLEKNQTNRYYPSAYQLTPSPMGTGSSLVLRHHPSIAIRKVGMIAAANADYTCFYTRRKIILVDTRTGKIRWTHENVDNETRVLGDDHLIYLVTRDRITKKILRVSDGQPVPITQAGDDLQHAIYQGEAAFVSISSPNDKKWPGQKPGQTAVYCFHLQSKELNWSIDFPRDSQFELFNQHYLSVLTPKGEISIVDLRTGKKSSLEPLSQEELKKHKKFYLVTDQAYIYFVGHTPTHNSISISVPAIPINGMLYVYDRQTGKRLWNQEFQKKHLVLNPQNLLPVILLVAREYKQIGNRHTSIFNLQAVNKQSGKSFLTWEAPVEPNIRAINIDYQQKMIEILTYGARIWLYDTDELADRSSENPEQPLPE
tara:strand:+ start:30680 stop:35317 length:4638 start_codon:yes stop_codon:yes gene_type:complete